MTKGFQAELDEEGKRTFRSLHIGADEVQNHDGTFALLTANGALTHPELRNNVFGSRTIDFTAGVWNNEIEIRPNSPFRGMLRTKSVVSGTHNPSANVLDLANGSGDSSNGDVFVFTWIQEGSLNKNLTGFLAWLKRIGIGGNSPNSTIRVSIFDVTSIAEQVGGEYTGALADPSNGIDSDPITLDPENYYTAALDYIEVAFNDATTNVEGTPIYFNVNLNSDGSGTVFLEDGKVYALVIYLYNSGGAETNTLATFGSERTDVDTKSRFYFGSSGWGGSLAEDTNVKRMTHRLFNVVDAVINQIHIYSETGQTLGGVSIKTMMIEKNGDLFGTNIPDDDGKVLEREILSNLILADQKTHCIILEGKAVLPIGYHLHLIMQSPSTGAITIELNFWDRPIGEETLKA